MAIPTKDAALVVAMHLGKALWLVPGLTPCNSRVALGKR